ncbi:methyl-accepting chemotaxis protein, partial [Streptococcus suis]
GEIEWEVTFDTKNWSFSREHGAYYFSTPKGVQIIEFRDALGRDLLKNYNSSGTDGSKYRLFKDGESGFSDQWGWSV